MGIGKFFRRRQDDAVLEQELATHLDQEAEDNVARGMPQDEARRQAYLKLGSPRRVHEDLWEQNTLGFTQNLLRALVSALRRRHRHPRSSTLATMCTTVGNGTDVAVLRWTE